MSRTSCSARWSSYSIGKASSTLWRIGAHRVLGVGKHRGSEDEQGDAREDRSSDQHFLQHDCDSLRRALHNHRPTGYPEPLIRGIPGRDFREASDRGSRPSEAGRPESTARSLAVPRRTDDATYFPPALFHLAEELDRSVRDLPLRPGGAPAALGRLEDLGLALAGLAGPAVERLRGGTRRRPAPRPRAGACGTARGWRRPGTKSARGTRAPRSRSGGSSPRPRGSSAASWQASQRPEVGLVSSALPSPVSTKCARSLISGQSFTPPSRDPRTGSGAGRAA